MDFEQPLVHIEQLTLDINGNEGEPNTEPLNTERLINIETAIEAINTLLSDMDDKVKAIQDDHAGVLMELGGFEEELKEFDRSLGALNDIQGRHSGELHIFRDGMRATGEDYLELKDDIKEIKEQLGNRDDIKRIKEQLGNQMDDSDPSMEERLDQLFERIADIEENFLLEEMFENNGGALEARFVKHWHTITKLDDFVRDFYQRFVERGVDFSELNIGDRLDEIEDEVYEQGLRGRIGELEMLVRDVENSTINEFKTTDQRLDSIELDIDHHKVMHHISEGTDEKRQEKYRELEERVERLEERLGDQLNEDELNNHD